MPILFLKYGDRYVTTPHKTTSKIELRAPIRNHTKHFMVVLLFICLIIALFLVLFKVQGVGKAVDVGRVGIGCVEDDFLEENVCFNNQILLDYSCVQGLVVVHETLCERGCFNNSIGEGNCFEGCVDSDGENSTSLGNVSGLESSGLGEGRYERQLVIKEDGCLDSQNLVEQICSDNGYVASRIISCPRRTVCLQGGCVLSGPAEVFDSSKALTVIRLPDLVEFVNSSFWVIVSFKDAQGTILFTHKELFYYEMGVRDYSLSHHYHNENAIFTKEVVVYDVPDPSRWNIYLNGTYRENFTVSS